MIFLLSEVKEICLSFRLPLSSSKKTQDKYTTKLWADRVPTAWKPYVQLTRIDLFVGSLMIFWPCTWGLTLAAQATYMPLHIYIDQLAVWLLWSIILHSVGSTWNDIMDIEFDKQVERTKSRPLATGAISVKAALLWMSPQIIALLVLLGCFNRLTLYFGIFELFVLASLYPFMKRVTNLPQVWLGISFTWCAIIAWAANSALEWKILITVMLTGTIWTTYCDTFYAMLDKKDDPTAGVKSTALLFGSQARMILFLLATFFVIGMTMIGLLAQQRIPYYVFNVAVTALHLLRQVMEVDFEDPSSCMKTFKSNGGELGYIVWAGFLWTYIFPK
ncbi:hypothetical protein M422DRAFT_157793 [Sphaerobolus stellatus SS14]|nr:hypothetical protein M422DRAFT_157793 [Sphaerobolus stellatus SS14]